MDILRSVQAQFVVENYCYIPPKSTVRGKSKIIAEICKRSTSLSKRRLKIARVSPLLSLMALPQRLNVAYGKHYVIISHAVSIPVITICLVSYVWYRILFIHLFHFISVYLPYVITNIVQEVIVLADIAILMLALLSLNTLIKIYNKPEGAQIRLTKVFLL